MSALWPDSWDRRHRLHACGWALLVLLPTLAVVGYYLPPRGTKLDWMRQTPRQLVVSADGTTLAAADGSVLTIVDVASQHTRDATPYPWDYDHLSDANNILLSPDGGKVALQNEDLTPPRVRLWHPGPGRPPITLPDSLSAVGFTADSRKLILWGSSNHTIVDATTGAPVPLPADMGKLVQSVNTLPGGPVALEYRNDDGWFAPERSLVVWDLDHARVQIVIPNAMGPAGLSADGALIAIATTHGLRLHDGVSGALLATVPMVLDEDDPYVPTFSPDGRRLLLNAGWELRHGFHAPGVPGAEVWDISALPPHRLATLGYNRARFTANSQWVIADRSLNIANLEFFDAETAQSRLSWSFTYINSLVVAPDGKTFVTVHEDTRPATSILERLLPRRKRGSQAVVATIWSVPRGEVLHRINGATAVAYFPDGQSIAVGRADGAIERWQIPPRTPWPLTILFALVLVLTVAALGSWLLAWLSQPTAAAEPAGSLAVHSGE